MLQNNSYLRITIIFSLIFLAFSACKNKEATHSASSNVPVYQTEEFMAFYDKFSTDSIYQLDHTVFPLEGVKAQTDSLDTPDPAFRWQRESWTLHKPYDDMDGTFSREMLDLSGLVIERISDQSGKYTMERRFGKLSAGWHLIYYREMGIY
jgi:hypothetical protein